MNMVEMDLRNTVEDLRKKLIEAREERDVYKKAVERLQNECDDERANLLSNIDNDRREGETRSETYARMYRERRVLREALSRLMMRLHDHRVHVECDGVQGLLKLDLDVARAALETV